MISQCYLQIDCSQQNNSQQSVYLWCQIRNNTWILIIWCQTNVWFGTLECMQMYHFKPTCYYWAIVPDTKTNPQVIHITRDVIYKPDGLIINIQCLPWNNKTTMINGRICKHFIARLENVTCVPVSGCKQTDHILTIMHSVNPAIPTPPDPGMRQWPMRGQDQGQKGEHTIDHSTT